MRYTHRVARVRSPAGREVSRAKRVRCAPRKPTEAVPGRGDRREDREDRKRRRERANSLGSRARQRSSVVSRGDLAGPRANTSASERARI